SEWWAMPTLQNHIDHHFPKELPMQSLDRVTDYRNADPAPEIEYRGHKSGNRKPVTRKQKLFVEQCLGSEKTFDEVMKDHHVTPERFANWMLQGSFRKYLKGIRRSLAEQAKMILSIGGKRSAAFLFRTASIGSTSPREDRKRSSQCRAAQTLARF